MLENKLNPYMTPYKYGQPVLIGGEKGSFDSQAVDIPFVFYHNNQFYMMYTGYDGVGYQTGMAISDDLLHWEKKGIVLKREDNNRWDSVGSAGTWIIKESDDLYAVPRLKKIQGRYWMVFHSYPAEGYEAGPAQIGLAWCEEEDLLQWTKLEEPIFSYQGGESWEEGGLYKACIIEKDNLYYMFYNAKTSDERWIEQTGLAISRDLFNWERFENNPILKTSSQGWDSKFVSDPCILNDNGLWVNYFFGYDYEHAREGIAFSQNLYEWEKHEKPIISNGPAESIDDKHAHKASIIFHEGNLYHFYTAVRDYQKGDYTNLDGEFRCITVATSIVI